VWEGCLIATTEDYHWLPGRNRLWHSSDQRMNSVVAVICIRLVSFVSFTFTPHLYRFPHNCYLESVPFSITASLNSVHALRRRLIGKAGLITFSIVNFARTHLIIPLLLLDLNFGAFCDCRSTSPHAIVRVWRVFFHFLTYCFDLRYNSRVCCRGPWVKESGQRSYHAAIRRMSLRSWRSCVRTILYSTYSCVVVVRMNWIVTS